MLCCEGRRVCAFGMAAGGGACTCYSFGGGACVWPGGRWWGVRMLQPGSRWWGMHELVGLCIWDMRSQAAL